MFSAVVLLSSLHPMVLDCSPGCTKRPSKDLAARICAANGEVNPQAEDALQEYNCKAGYTPEELMNYMCLCDQDQDAPDASSSHCSDHCRGWGCCLPGQVCISSHVLHSDSNRCFDSRTNTISSPTVSPQCKTSMPTDVLPTIDGVDELLLQALATFSAKLNP